MDNLSIYIKIINKINLFNLIHHRNLVKINHSFLKPGNFLCLNNTTEFLHFFLYIFIQFFFILFCQKFSFQINRLTCNKCILNKNN
jgi:hypothetical protein